MKTKKFIAIKIMCFALSGLLLSSSVIMSNQKALTVEAAEESNIIAQVVYFIGSVVGVILTGPNVVSITNMLGSGILLGGSIYDYVTDNGDGTYTIDEQLIQEVLNAMQDVENSTFSDNDVVDIFNGTAYEYSGRVYHQIVNSSNGNTYTNIYTFNSVENTPCCCFIIPWSTSDTRIILFKYNGSSVASWSVTGYRESYIGDSVNSSLNGSFSNSDFYLSSTSDTSVVWDYSFNFPVFENEADATNYLKSGTGYEKALNYSAEPESFEYSSRYTGTYNGGNVTISATKLNAIEDKLDELNSTEKSTDEKVEEIVDWLNNTDDSADDNTSSGSGDSGSDTGSGGDSGSGSGTGSGGDSGSGSSGGGLPSFLDGLGSIGDAILSILGKLLEYVGKALELFTSTITKVLDIVPSGFTQLLTALFPFIPQEWVVAIELTLVLGVILMLVKVFKK